MEEENSACRCDKASQQLGHLPQTTYPLVYAQLLLHHIMLTKLSLDVSTLNSTTKKLAVAIDIHQ
jgi:hypothetical protein